MLFDLRGRGRRRTVKVIYMGLALLFGAGFLFLGIGVGAGGGGILNAFTENEGSGGTTFAKEIKKYRKLTAEHPGEASAWEQLLKVQLHEAGNEEFVSHSGQITSKGKELFKEAATTWHTYVGLAGAKPNSELAQQMVVIFSKEGLDEPASEVQVLQIVTAARPTSASYYAELAEYAYMAHNPGVGDLAGERAVSLAPVGDRATLKSELAEVKKNPGGPTEATSSTGQKYTLKRGANGTFTATPTESSTKK